MLVDLAGTPRVLSRAAVDGSLVDARQVGAIARVVVRSSPRLDVPDTPATRPPAERTRRQPGRHRRGRRSRPGCPGSRSTTGGATTRSQVDCDAISRPATYSGTNCSPC